MMMLILKIFNFKNFIHLRLFCLYSVIKYMHEYAFENG